jgi:glycosyltransferase involved in cell wall biosynthesis
VVAGAKWSEHFYQQLKSFIRLNRLGGFVEMLGGIYGPNKETLFDSSNIFVFPTRYEAFGLVNLEAMRSGLPVISSPEGAVPEVVRHGVTGFLVDPTDPQAIADCILKLAENPGLRDQMGMAGRARFEKEYTFEVYVAKWKAMLSSLEKQKHLQKTSMVLACN